MVSNGQSWTRVLQTKKLQWKPFELVLWTVMHQRQIGTYLWIFLEAAETEINDPIFGYEAL